MGKTDHVKCDCRLKSSLTKGSERRGASFTNVRFADAAVYSELGKAELLTGTMDVSGFRLAAKTAKDGIIT